MEIYCDESRPEVIFGENSTDRYMVIGGIWIPHNSRQNIKEEIKQLKEKHRLYGEIKWRNVAPSKIDFYLELVDLFFNNPDLRFRCIVVDSFSVDLETYHDSDSELGFYKFYYQLLKHWIETGENYWIFLDHKKNKLPDRLHTLKRFLNRSTLGNVNEIQAIESKESLLIQLADVLMGAVGYKFHNKNTSEAKLRIVSKIEEHIGRPIQNGTYRNTHKFNIFWINLR